VEGLGEGDTHVSTTKTLKVDSLTPTSVAIIVLRLALSSSEGTSEAVMLKDTSTVTVSAVDGTNVGAEEGVVVGLLGAGVGGSTTLRVFE
jgi:ABC-type multidrug transport system ATPase subunit